MNRLHTSGKINGSNTPHTLDTSKLNTHIRYIIHNEPSGHIPRNQHIQFIEHFTESAISKGRARAGGKTSKHHARTEQSEGKRIDRACARKNRNRYTDKTSKTIGHSNNTRQSNNTQLSTTVSNVKSNKMNTKKLPVEFYCDIIGLPHKWASDKDKIRLFSKKIEDRVRFHDYKYDIMSGVDIVVSALTDTSFPDALGPPPATMAQYDILTEARRLLTEIYKKAAEERAKATSLNQCGTPDGAIVLSLEPAEPPGAPDTPAATPAPTEVTTTPTTTPAATERTEFFTGEEEDEGPSHGETVGFRYDVEKIRTHFYRKNKDKSEKLTFACQWRGFNHESEETIESAMKAKRAMTEYLANCSKRAKTTLFKRYPELAQWVKK